MIIFQLSGLGLCFCRFWICSSISVLWLSCSDTFFLLLGFSFADCPFHTSYPSLQVISFTAMDICLHEYSYEPLYFWHCLPVSPFSFLSLFFDSSLFFSMSLAKGFYQFCLSSSKKEISVTLIIVFFISFSIYHLSWSLWDASSFLNYSGLFEFLFSSCFQGGESQGYLYSMLFSVSLRAGLALRMNFLWENPLSVLLLLVLSSECGLPAQLALSKYLFLLIFSKLLLIETRYLIPCSFMFHVFFSFLLISSFTAL